MKIQLSLWLLISFSVTCLAAASWMKWKASLQIRLNELLISQYRKELIPAYQKKKQLLESILKESDIQDPAITGILSHVPHWNVLTMKDIAEIEELNAGIDTWYSKHSDQLMTAQKTKRSLNTFLTDLQKLEADLAARKTELLSSAGSRFYETPKMPVL